MKTTMKMTKRFFALLTAMVLCLAPMALMVGAAVADTVCPHYNVANIDYISYVETVKLADATGCYMWVWNAQYTCDICQWHWEGIYRDIQRHHYAANGVCAYCGYDSNNE